MLAAMTATSVYVLFVVPAFSSVEMLRNCMNKGRGKAKDVSDCLRRIHVPGQETLPGEPTPEVV